VLALRKSQSKGIAVAGIVLGGAATLTSLVLTVLVPVAIFSAPMQGPATNALFPELSSKPTSEATKLEAEPAPTVGTSPLYLSWWENGRALIQKAN
jgi:hypothetical protein